MVVCILFFNSCNVNACYEHTLPQISIPRFWPRHKPQWISLETSRKHFLNRTTFFPRSNLAINVVLQFLHLYKWKALNLFLPRSALHELLLCISCGAHLGRYPWKYNSNMFIFQARCGFWSEENEMEKYREGRTRRFSTAVCFVITKRFPNFPSAAFLRSWSYIFSTIVTNAWNNSGTSILTSLQQF